MATGWAIDMNGSRERDFGGFDGEKDGWNCLRRRMLAGMGASGDRMPSRGGDMSGVVCLMIGAISSVGVTSG